QFALKPGACYCLALSESSRRREEADVPGANAVPPPHVGGYVSGDAYRRARAQAAFAVSAPSQVVEPEALGPHDSRALASCTARGFRRQPEKVMPNWSWSDTASRSSKWQEE